VPGVPATVHTQPFGEPTAGAELKTFDPAGHVPVVGIAVANVTSFPAMSKEPEYSSAGTLI